MYVEDRIDLENLMYLHSGRKCGIFLHTAIHSSVQLSLAHTSVQIFNTNMWNFSIHIDV